MRIHHKITHFISIGIVYVRGIICAKPLILIRRVYSRLRLCGISAIWKKMPHKIYVAASNGAQKKIDPRISFFFFFEEAFIYVKHYSPNNLMFSTCKPVNDNFNKRSFSHGTVCTNKFKYLLGEPLSRTPLLEKGPPKITERGQFFSFHSFIGYSSYHLQYKFIIQHKSKKKKNPHWPIS